MSQFTYRQPIKQTVRKRILSTALDLLTSSRLMSPLVVEDELLEVLAFATLTIAEKHLTEDVQAEYQRWCQLYRDRIGYRKASQIKVLYLCGPEPLNDLEVLLDCGVDATNVWAVESKKKDFAQALTELRRSKIPIKLHYGNLSEFFEAYPESFDLVYYDSSGSLLAGKPNSLDPILKLFAFNRLEPLAVLITNFSEPPTEMTERFAKILAAYFRFRYRDFPKAAWDAGLDPAICEADATDLLATIKSNIEPFYSDFITRFVTDLGRYWIPSCRALVMKSVSASYLNSSDQVQETRFRAVRVPEYAGSLNKWLRELGHAVVSPSSYPLFSFFRAMKQLKPPDPLVSQLGNLVIRGQQIGDYIEIASMLDRVVEGHWDLLSEEMKRAVAVSWFDRHHRFSCDIPLPNLLINSLLGTYGHPVFPNPRRSSRIKYRAKSMSMFTDLFVLDQCRYYFDWLPTLEMVPTRFASRSVQILARCILDRIGRFDWSSETHPFRGAAVAAFGEISSAQAYDFSEREVISDRSEPGSDQRNLDSAIKIT